MLEKTIMYILELDLVKVASERIYNLTLFMALVDQRIVDLVRNALDVA